jgi:hypothetical protein
MRKPKGKAMKASKPATGGRTVSSAPPLEKTFDILAHNRLVKEVWDEIQAKVDGLTNEQCYALLDRHTDGHRDFAKEFAKSVGEVWDGATCEIVGGAVYRAVLCRVGAYDPIYRPAPEIVPMGEFDECLVFYHTSEGQFEVFKGTKRERFTARFNPLCGVDLEDMHMITEIVRKFNTLRVA